uniref:Cadherin domain-containing protein n=1 Tax=Timema shepardi TaxID=629360 RepID=A0A7R9ARZ6_TIMSH|nr:unnamed protein product [Timema shepardi]
MIPSKSVTTHFIPRGYMAHGAHEEGQRRKGAKICKIYLMTRLSNIPTQRRADEDVLSGWKSHDYSDNSTRDSCAVMCDASQENVDATVGPSRLTSTNSREGVVPGQVMMCGIASSFRMRDRSTFKVRLKAESYWQWILLVLLVGLCLEVAANRPPRFLINGQTEIVLRLKEGAETPVGSLIYRLHGADPDGDPLVFGVREQVGNDLLRIENLGTNEANVYLKQELDRELKDEYSLVLTLTDGHLGEGNFITQSLLLLVEDVNDNEPVFKPYQPTIVVPENSPPGVLTTVEATDQDEGPYGQTLRGQSSHILEVDPPSTKKPLGMPNAKSCHDNLLPPR